MPWRPDRFGCDIRLSCIGRDALSGTAELITDAAKYKKAVQIGAVATTVLYEGLYTMREAQRRRRQEEKPAECRSEHAEHHER
jgi:hypothetical protein